MRAVDTILIIALFALLPCSAATSFANADVADEITTSSDKQQVRVLYAGKPGSARMADYQRFLRQHFDTVSTMSLGAFTASAAENFDVVIFDWDSIYPRDAQGRIVQGSLQRVPVPTLPDDYAKPTIMIGSVAGRVGQNPTLGLKIDWL